MSDINTVEGLMIFLINTFADKFPQSAILKGGMCLRLLDCPRLTNDIDYIFIPYSSKKDILGNILTVLDNIAGLKYEYSMNSKCLRIRIKYGALTTQIEVSVAEECATTSISTATLSRKLGLLGRVVSVVDYRVAMANKLAAWNERALLRDLYDLYFFYTMIETMPDMNILKQRLSKVASTPTNKNPKQMTIEQLVIKLRNNLGELSPKSMLELTDYLPIGDVRGLDIKIRTNLRQFCAELGDI